MTEKSAYHVLLTDHDKEDARLLTLTERDGDLDAARGITNAMPYSIVAWTIVVLVFAGCYYLL